MTAAQRGNVTYERRILDEELNALLPQLAAIAIEGPKAVGKTATAVQRARTIYRLDDAAQAEVATADPGRLATGDEPILIDEWQRLSSSWDVVRRAVDADSRPGRFLLTGSASPISPPTHSGAGRIVRVRMRPLSLAERGVARPTVPLGRMLEGPGSSIQGETSLDLTGYAEEIVRSGFPGMRMLNGRALRSQLDGYIDRIVDHDFEEMGQRVRRPATLRRWLTAYAAATATTSTIEAIRDAATSNEGDKPTRATVLSYREVLSRLWVLDPVPAWGPTRNHLSRLAYPEKHHIADPALAARLLGIDRAGLIEGREGAATIPRDGTLLGHLFESLVTQSVRVYAQANEASVKHLRTKGGRQEIDLIVERADGRVVALEVKLTRTVADHDVRHLLWLKRQIGQDLLDAAILTTGPSAYRRTDGVAVIPAALLGP